MFLKGSSVTQRERVISHFPIRAGLIFWPRSPAAIRCRIHSLRDNRPRASAIGSIQSSGTTS